ncbi:response regulator [Povalibacter sp.]|uniref:response regulator n=1 Tax=Povalibacter sp. TaxID=1962978 RepID=UPI002F41C10E
MHATAGEGSDAGTAGAGDSDLLRGLKILLVEDDFIVAFDMQGLLQDYGAEVLGPVSSVAEGQAIVASQQADAAVLDVNLNGEFVFALAGQLRQQGVPLLFATAHADDDALFPAPERTAPRVAKPVLPSVLIAQLRKLVGR